MNQPSYRFSALAALVAVALVGVFLPQARSQVQTAPNFLPIGVASSGNSTTAWFHEPSTGRAMACQSSPTAVGPSPIQCVTVKLPRAEP